MKKIILLLLAGILLYSCKKYNVADQANNNNAAPGSPNFKLASAPTDLCYTANLYAGVTGTSGITNGTKLSATFKVPDGIAFTSDGTMYVADRDNNCIRKITTGGTVSVYAGSTTGVAGFVNGTGTAARFASPTKIAIDGSNNMYIADRDNNVIRKITYSTGAVTTLAGSSTGVAAFTDGTGSAARFHFPVGVACTSTGTVYVADTRNHAIRQITPAGVVTTIAGTGTPGYVTGANSSAQFNNPCGIAINAAGNLIVADRYNHCVRKVHLDTHNTNNIAGMPGQQGLRDGPAGSAKFDEPFGVAVAADGTIFIADYANQCIRRLNTDNEVTTVSGQQTTGSTNGDYAKFSGPLDISIDSSGKLYVPESGNSTIRQLVTTTRLLRNTLGWTQQSLGTGLTWYKYNQKDFYYLRWANTVGLLDSGIQNINVIDIDLAYYKLVISARTDHDSTSVSGMAGDIAGAVAAINGNFSEHSTVDGSGHHTHDSFIRIAGTDFYPYLIPPSDTYRWWKHFGAFYYNESTSAAGFLQDSTSTNMYGSFSATTYPTILSGAPMLVKSTNIVGPSAFANATLQTHDATFDNFPRTAIGRVGTHVLLITVDGWEHHTTGVVGIGMNTGDLAQIMHDYFGVSDALNIDGGGSTTMWINGQGDRGIVNVPSGIPTATLPYDRQRISLQSALVVVPKP